MNAKKEIDSTHKIIFITGVAGFIGAALAQRICRENPSARVILV